jgi:sterol desaturase/sphingolipid hydroxylase (fatty acid hydroxylase superfamily)
MSSDFMAGLGIGAPSRQLTAVIAIGMMLIEYLFHRLNRASNYDASETAASLAIALCNKAIRGALGTTLAFPYAVAYQHRLFSIPLDNPWSWLALFLGVEFCYYVHHVAMHRIRWFWATHAVHHSATRLNLSAAIRINGWGGYLTGGFLFYLPLLVLGFSPIAVIGVLSLGLFYQFFLHVESPPSLGPLEWIFNTPMHHHVHHASNPDCLDRNFGSVLIIFDRLFGTFGEAPDGEQLRFGIVGAVPTNNPVWILFSNWRDMFRDTLSAQSPAEKFRALFGRPRARGL